MNDMSLTSTSDHGACVDKCAHVIDVVVIPVVWVDNVARVVFEVNGAVRSVWIVCVIDGRLIGCVKLVHRVIVKTDKTNVSWNR